MDFVLCSNLAKCDDAEEIMEFLLQIENDTSYKLLKPPLTRCICQARRCLMHQPSQVRLKPGQSGHHFHFDGSLPAFTLQEGRRQGGR